MQTDRENETERHRKRKKNRRTERDGERQRDFLFHCISNDRIFHFHLIPQSPFASLFNKSEKHTMSTEYQQHVDIGRQTDSDTSRMTERQQGRHRNRPRV